MSKCSMIQPFDGGTFDRRYDEVFAPAIRKAGLEPYRVDRDPSANIPINDIEKGIQDSDICLADITTDNPNVWYELGFAIAAQKEVVLICSDERTTKFPFDVQHRNIIRYNTTSPSDFVTLAESIVKRAKALLNKERQLAKVASSSSVADTEGLSPHEVVALVTVMENQFSPQDSVASFQVRADMNKAGYTDIAASLGLRGLSRKGFLSFAVDQDINGNTFSVYKVTEKGENWLFSNQEKLVLRRMGENESTEPGSKIDDLPF